MRKDLSSGIRAIASINETPAQKAAKRRRLNEKAKDVEQLKQHLEIMSDEDNNVYTEATPLTRKTTLKAMFRRPDGQDQVWMNQRSVHDQAKIPTLEVYIGSDAECITAKSGRAE
nr:hypothetical protein [Tanacetum cinerariifolium]